MVLNSFLERLWGKRRKSEDLQKGGKSEGSSETVVVTDKQRLMTLTDTDFETQHKTYSPIVEHPLLTIQDRISKLEELYRGMSERIATKQDTDEIKNMVEYNTAKIVGVAGKLNDIDGKFEDLHERRRQLTRQLTTNQVELKDIEQELSLLDADKKILELLNGREYSSIELSKRLNYTRQYIWERIKDLMKNGLVKRFKVGRKIKYSLPK